ncbi:MAG: hypothetical protein OEV70_11070, partial [Nitrospirota bacterium]|nr:hypothetical protein [Nitrospirota bacterium]
NDSRKAGCLDQEIFRPRALILRSTESVELSTCAIPSIFRRFYVFLIAALRSLEGFVILIPGDGYNTQNLQESRERHAQ